MTPILLDGQEQQALEHGLFSPDAQVRKRAQIILSYNAGAPTRQVAEEVGLSRGRTRYYRHQFELHRMEMFSSSSPYPLPRGEGEETISLLPMGEGSGLREDSKAPNFVLPHEELPTEETTDRRDARRTAKRVVKQAAKRATKQARKDAAIAAQEAAPDLTSPLDPLLSPEQDRDSAVAAPQDNQPLLPVAETTEQRDTRRAAKRIVKRAAKQARKDAAIIAQETLPPSSALTEPEGWDVRMTHPLLEDDYILATGEGTWSAAPLQRPIPEEGEIEGELPLPRPLASPGVQPDDPLAEAGRKILLFHFAEMLRHEEGTLLGEEIEALHDMRVATRRMRAAMDVFGYTYKPKTVQAHLKGLRAIGRLLGRVRDLDVFIEKVNAYVERLDADSRAGMEPLLAAWHAQRDLYRDQMAEHLHSQAYAEFKQNYNLFLQTPGMGVPKPEIEPLPTAMLVRHVAPTLIYTRLAAVRAFETILPTASVPQLHLLRIEFKKLRYTMEYFQEVLGKESRQVINEIKKIQDHLGELQDAEVACQMVRQFLDEWDQNQTALPLAQRQSPEVIVNYLANRHAERHTLITTFPQTWASFNSPEFQRNLALSISVL